MVQREALRRFCRALTSRLTVRRSGMRRSRHCRVRTPISISAMFSQLVLGRVVKLDTAQQTLCGVDTEHFLKAAAKVGAEVVHHQMHATCGTVDVLEQMAGKAHEVRPGASLGHEHAAPAGLHIECPRSRRRPHRLYPRCTGLSPAPGDIVRCLDESNDRGSRTLFRANRSSTIVGAETRSVTQ